MFNFLKRKKNGIFSKHEKDVSPIVSYEYEKTFKYDKEHDLIFGDDFITKPDRVRFYAKRKLGIEDYNFGVLYKSAQIGVYPVNNSENDDVYKFKLSFLENINEKSIYHSMFGKRHIGLHPDTVLTDDDFEFYVPSYVNIKEFMGGFLIGYSNLGSDKIVARITETEIEVIRCAHGKAIDYTSVDIYDFFEFKEDFHKQCDKEGFTTKYLESFDSFDELLKEYNSTKQQ